MANNKLNILRSKADFARLRESGKVIKTKKWFFISYLHNNLPHNRFGWTVSAKVGPAVTRNRLKRWCRQYFRENQKINEKKLDINVIFRPSDKEFFKNLQYSVFVTSLDASWKSLNSKPKND